MMLLTEKIKTDKGIKTVETIADDKGVYVRTFKGKGAKEVCYKTKPGDCDVTKLLRLVYNATIL